MTLWRLRATVGAALVIIGCGSVSQGGTDSGQPGTGGGSAGGDTLPTCPAGWWVDPASDCSIACPGAPECGADCEFVTYLGLMPDAGSLEGALTISPSKGTLTHFAGAPSADEWSVTVDGGLRTARSGGVAPYTCHTNALDIGLVTKTRASARLESALHTAVDSAQWTRSPY